MTTASSQSYHNAVFSVVEEQATHASRFADGRRAYDRFYDLAARIGSEKATDVLPNEAAVVAELEANTPDRNRQVAMVREALMLSLETEMRGIAEASVMSGGSIIGRLRADLQQLGRYRKESLDGIDGKFWDVVQQGHGAFKQERDRMINRIMSAWCEVYEIKPATMVDAASTFSFIPDKYMSGMYWDMSSEASAERWRSYPFDLVADLDEVRNWEERNPEAVEALLAHLAHGRGLSR